MLVRGSRPAATIGARLLGTLVVGLIVGGCRCVAGEDRRSSASEEDRGSGRAARSAPDDAWLAGDLARQIPTGAKPQRGGQIVVQLSVEPPSLNTIVDSDAWAHYLTGHHLYESLLGRDPYDDPAYKFVPELAERWEVSDDHLAYTFHLRRDVKWHDGRPFTARDVVETFRKVQDNATRAAHIRSYTDALQTFEAVDDHTVRFVWREPYFLALDNPFASVPVQPAHVIAHLTGAQYNEAATNPLNRHPVGTGPWKFEGWRSNEKIVLARNEHYWGRAPYLDRVVFRIVKEEAIGLQLAERAELDVVTRITPESWQEMRDNPALRDRFFRSRYFDNNYAWIGWNRRRPQFRDARVRRALTMLIDRPGIIRHLFHDVVKPTTCHFYWASDACPDTDPLPYDPQAALTLLEDAGWRDGDGDGVLDREGIPFEFQFMVPASSRDAARMGAKIKEDMKRAGIAMKLLQVEWSAFVKRLRERSFDACTLLWADTSPDTDPAQIWHSRSIKGGSNYIGFQNSEVDRLIERGKTTFDRETRNQMYRKLGRILHAEQPYTWLYVRPRLTLIDRRIRGVKESLMFWQFEDFWLDRSR